MKESIVCPPSGSPAEYHSPRLFIHSYQYHWLGLGLETPDLCGRGDCAGGVTGATAATNPATSDILAQSRVFVRPGLQHTHRHSPRH